MNSNLIRNTSKRNLSLSRRRWISSSSSSSTPSTSASTSTPTTASSSPSASSSTSSSTIRAALLLSRPPTILREPSELESSYFKYNQKLKFNLAQPFPKDFYFKKGSSAESRFLSEQEQRSKELGSHFNNESSSNSISSKKSSSGKKTDAKEKQDSSSSSSSSNESTNPDQDLYKTLDRRTEADQKNDFQSLERKLDENLWLFVKEKKAKKSESGWRLPSKKIGQGEQKELLHKAAPSALTSILGSEMDLWIISNLPVGLVNKGQGVSEKTYILPAHILSGSPSKSLAEKNGVEFLWLTKEEAEKKINDSEDGKEYWNRIQGLLD